MGAGAGLPADLNGPVELELAKAVPTLPGPHAMPGGTRWELKWTACGRQSSAGHDTVRIWSRNKTEMTASYPEIAAAALAVLPANSVCDGELVCWDGERLSFELLQQRLAAGTRRAQVLATAHPASYVVFDVLAAHGVDLRGRPFDERHAALDALTTWSPPLHLSPITDDFDTAKSWLVDHARTDAGIEGML